MLSKHICWLHTGLGTWPWSSVNSLRFRPGHWQRSVWSGGYVSEWLKRNWRISFHHGTGCWTVQARQYRSGSGSPQTRSQPANCASRKYGPVCMFLRQTS